MKTTLVACAFVLGALASGPARAEEATGAQVVDAKAKLLEVVCGTEAQSADRVKAVKDLGAIDTSAATVALLEALDKLSVRTEELETRAEKQRAAMEFLKDPNALSAKEKELRKRILKEMEERDALLRGDLQVEQAFVDAIAALKNKESIAVLDRAVANHPLAHSRLAIYSGLLRNATTKAADWAKRALADPSPIVVLAVLNTFSDRADRSLTPIAVKLLKSSDPTVRRAAIRTLSAIGDKSATDELIQAMTADDGGMVEEYAEVLRKLTGATIGADAMSWKKWYDSHKSDLASKGEMGPNQNLGKVKVEPTTEIAGVPTFGKTIAFVLDVSGSMNEEIGYGGVTTGEWLTGKKIDIAKKLLKQAISKLPEAVGFNVIVFNHEVWMIEEQMIAATKSNKAMVNIKVDELAARGATYTYGALKAAFGLMGHMTGKPYDTIILLSDGAPTEALEENATEAKPMDPQVVLDAVKSWNKYKEVTVHTIAIDPRIEKTGKAFIAFMKDLAAQNKGKMTAIGTEQQGGGAQATEKK